MQTIETVIRSCWDHYAFDDATFLSEVYFAETGTDNALHFLATSYYRSGQHSSTYLLLKTYGTRTAETKFLFAKCCEDVDHLAEAESTIEGCSLIYDQQNNTNTINTTTVEEYGTSNAFVQKLLGRIFSKTNRIPQSIEAHKRTLDINPFLFTSFTALRCLGGNTDADEIFYPPAKFLRKASSIVNNSCNGNGSGCRTAAAVLNGRDSTNSESGVNTSGNSNLNIVDNNNSRNQQQQQQQIVSPAATLDQCDVKQPPKAPKKQPSKRLQQNSSDICSTTTTTTGAPPATTISHTTQMVTRQRSSTVLSQNNQSQMITRRSNRLFQNSVKENEMAPGSRLQQQQNLLKTTARPRISRLRKSENNNSNSRIDEMNEINSNGQQRRTTTMNNNMNQRNVTNSGTTLSRTPLIEKLCKLDDNSGKDADSEDKLYKSSSTLNENLINKDDDFDGGDKTKSTVSEADKIFLTAFVEVIKNLADIETSLSNFDFKRLLELTQTLPERHKNSPLVLCSLGRTYFELADYSKAVHYFEECHQKFDYFVKGVEYYSVALWHLQMELELSALAQEMVEKHPYAPESWCAAGNCFSLQKEQETAVKFFQRAIQLNPEFSYAYTLLGHEYIAMEEYEKATQAFRAALRYQPRHYNAWYGLGLIYYKQEKKALANVHFMRALKINPKNSVLLCNISLAQQGNEFRDKALGFLEEALTLAPKNALCRYHKAQLLFSEEKYDAALAEINDLKQIAPKEPLVYFLAGKIHKKIGQPHLALMNFSWATELDPRGEQHNPILGGDRRYDEEPVTALAAFEPEDSGDVQIMDSDEST